MPNIPPQVDRKPSNYEVLNENGVYKMIDLSFDRNELSIPAKEILAVVDKYIDAIEKRYGEGAVKELPIHWRYFDDLDKSMRYHTEDNQSITDRTFRGVVLVRDSESWDQ